MPAFEMLHVTWRKSSLCSGGDCVEVAVTDNTGTGHVFLMRNSKDPAGEILQLTSEEWEGFISYIKDGPGLLLKRFQRRLVLRPAPKC
jgi:Domain of unknown function (DUF397)